MGVATETGPALLKALLDGRLHLHVHRLKDGTIRLSLSLAPLDALQLKNDMAAVAQSRQTFCTTPLSGGFAPSSRPAAMLDVQQANIVNDTLNAIITNVNTLTEHGKVLNQHINDGLEDVQSELFKVLDKQECRIEAETKRMEELQVEFSILHMSTSELHSTTQRTEREIQQLRASHEVEMRELQASNRALQASHQVDMRAHQADMETLHASNQALQASNQALHAEVRSLQAANEALQTSMQASNEALQASMQTSMQNMTQLLMQMMSQNATPPNTGPNAQ